jgi:hypothetical protein
MRRVGHPSMKKLLRWLEGEEPAVDSHVSTCVYCSGRLDHLLEEPETLVGPALRQVLVIPEQLPDRLQRTIDERLSSRADLTLVGELFGLPLRTARVMSSTSQGDE